MIEHAIVAAAEGRTSGALLVGLLLGLGIGLVVGPTLRAWLTVREWAQASREARLTDRVIARLELDERGADPGRDGDREGEADPWPTRP